MCVLCCNSSRLEEVEGERDRALKAVGELSSKTDSLEEQLERLGRLLKEAQDRAFDKAQQLQRAEVFEPTLFPSYGLGSCQEASIAAISVSNVSLKCVSLQHKPLRMSPSSSA